MRREGERRWDRLERKCFGLVNEIGVAESKFIFSLFLVATRSVGRSKTRSWGYLLHHQRRGVRIRVELEEEQDGFALHVGVREDVGLESLETTNANRQLPQLTCVMHGFALSSILNQMADDDSCFEYLV